jgi:diguanylate cyclase (GGDEF)-like protein
VVRAVHELGWVRAVEQLRDGPGRVGALAVGGQLVAAGVLALSALAALPHLLALEDLLLAAGLAVSARSTALAARRTVWWDSYPVAQLAAVVVLTLAGVVGAGGPAVSGLPYVLLVLCSAPYLSPLQSAVVVAACGGGHLAALVVHDPGPGLLQRWLAVTGLLVLVLLLSSAQGGDRPVLQDLVALEVTDPVTGLPNGRYLEQASQRVVGHTSRTAPVAVVVARLERLDDLTRDHGHHVVDMALNQLGRRLRAVLREDDLLARTAHDELVALLPRADGPYAAEVAGKLRAAGAAGDLPTPPLTTGVAAAQPRHAAGRVADLVARARAQQPAPTDGYDLVRG